MARLGVSHWQGKTTFQKHLQKEVGFDCLVLDEITKFSTFGHDVINLLYKFCAHRAPMGHIHAHSEEYQSWLNSIEHKLLDIRANLKHEEAETGSTTTQSESILVKELFILAVLLYIERTSNGTSDRPTIKNTEWTCAAFDIFSRIDSCNKPFAYVVFGCEARTDQDRTIILDVLDRTIESKANGLLHPLRDVMIKTWVHDDLKATVTLTEMSAEALCSSSCLILSTSHSVKCLV
ncbi:hypothetical protein TSTA_083040 [Talaromyces stipitatus ATCC 10500]|uniref:Uncharacterized protein n=1 Tax=Talaromyces stipitatus (strain ATCC 10500 / CBS 375.48 / QM 6759 / NRRL 1006) TaxID=441959 RepID=B8LZ27_TALSN|nr:uncharacterized protein TSTA_083040 [Talaromyces stipitatus ATCC 10500]EED21071.1 hypothetical protein TSTA_083040 [Talaromyces stipitatus ATCC 10500]